MSMSVLLIKTCYRYKAKYGQKCSKPQTFFKKARKGAKVLSYLTFITAIKWNSHQDCSKVMKENGEMRLCCWCFLTIVHCKSLKGGACKRRKMRVLLYLCADVTPPLLIFQIRNLQVYIICKKRKIRCYESHNIRIRKVPWLRANMVYFFQKYIVPMKYNSIEFVGKWAKMIKFNKKGNYSHDRIFLHVVIHSAWNVRKSGSEY